MTKHILAIDQGTTATTVLLLDANLKVLAKESTEILPEYPKYGWVEHDLEKVWSGTLSTISKVMQQHRAADIAAIGITNQRETVGAWNRNSGKALAPAIVWQCRRTTDRCNELKKVPGLADKVKRKTGLVLDPYFSASKMEWLKNNSEHVRASFDVGEAAFGNIDTFLLFRLSGGTAYATDVSNASRTMLMDLKSLAWDDELVNLFGLKKDALAKIAPSSGVFGHTKGLSVLPDGIPIAGILGDQQAALFGQLCLLPGETKCTYGTGSFLVCNTGKEIIYSKHGLLTTVAWQMNGEVCYALEGSAFVAGAAVQFLRDNLGIIKSSSEIEPLAHKANPEEMGDLIFVPSLTGLGAPYWVPEAKGMIYGMTRGMQKTHLARAVLEGIALQNDALFSAIQEDISPRKLNKIRVDGGASANNLLMQMQSDLAAIPIERPKILDTTAVGAALAAGLAVGVWKNADALQSVWSADRSFSPSLPDDVRSRMKMKWAHAVRRIQCP